MLKSNLGIYRKIEYFNSEKQFCVLDFQNHRSKVGFPVLLLGCNPLCLDSLTQEMVLKCIMALCDPQQRYCQQAVLRRRTVMLFIKSPRQPDLTWPSFEQEGVLVIPKLLPVSAILQILQILYLYAYISMFISNISHTYICVYIHKKESKRNIK